MDYLLKHDWLSQTQTTNTMQTVSVSKYLAHCFQFLQIHVETLACSAAQTVNIMFKSLTHFLTSSKITALCNNQHYMCV